jgi:hypothetical protein
MMNRSDLSNLKLDRCRSIPFSAFYGITGRRIFHRCLNSDGAKCKSFLQYRMLLIASALRHAQSAGGSKVAICWCTALAA